MVGSRTGRLDLPAPALGAGWDRRPGADPCRRLDLVRGCDGHRRRNVCVPAAGRRVERDRGGAERPGHRHLLPRV